MHHLVLCLDGFVRSDYCLIHIYHGTVGSEMLLLESRHLFSCGLVRGLQRVLVSQLVPVVRVLSQLGLDPGVVLDLPPGITRDANYEFLLTKKLIWVLLIAQII